MAAMITSLLALLLAGPAVAANPLLEPSPLPYQLPQFEKIKDSV